MVPKLCHEQEDNEKLAQEISLEQLVIWNVSKALEKSPNIPLKATIKEMQDNLAKKHTRNLSSNQGSPEQHLTCAVLAWQQLGHEDTESLYSFIQSHRNNIKNKEEGVCNQGRASAKISEKLLADVLLDSGLPAPAPHRSCFGEVVKLPVTTKKFVLRMDQSIISAKQSKGARSPVAKMSQPEEMQFVKEIQCICNKSCISCAARFLQLEEEEKELRQRAEQLAQRETERAELLEKATAAWVDLESKYHSRLNAAKEQAEIVIAKMERELEYRKVLKMESKVLAEELEELSNAAEAKRLVMLDIQEQVCKLACEQKSIMDEVKKGDTAFTDQQCKEAQLDRDLKLKEQQTRRKLFVAANDLDSASALLVETERAMRAELNALKDQIVALSEQLLYEDDLNVVLKEELKVIRIQKEQLILDVDGCKVICNNKMENDLQILHQKSEELMELEKKVVECKCKKPLEKSVEVKRTPSLAITCTCIEDGPDPTCSCKTLSSTVLSNLLASLFRGLQSEIGDAGIMMPCTLLKCLEDNHNWDKHTAVKTHLKTFFSQLLIGELDIAIAVAIENYHARWVGATCADMRAIPNIDDEKAKQMQEKAIEKRAQRLANNLAEDLFKERAEELTQNAKKICEANPRTCECDETETENEKDTAVYSCLVSQNVNPMNIHQRVDKNKCKTTGPGWKQTQQAVLEIKVELENLKKASIKKQDLRMMEEKIKKVIKGNTYNVLPVDEMLKNALAENETNAKLRYKSRKDYKPPEKFKGNKFVQSTRKLGQSFAVNVCFCDQSDKQVIPTKQNARAASEIMRNQPCPNKCICLNSAPDTESLDRFMENWNKNMQEMRLNGGGCQPLHMINPKESTNITQIIQPESGRQLIKDDNKIQSGSGSLKKDSSKGSHKSNKTQKNVVIAQKDSQFSKTNSTKQQTYRLTQANDKDNKNIQKAQFKDETEIFDEYRKPEKQQNEEKNVDCIKLQKSDLCKCSCYCDEKRIHKCSVRQDNSIYAMIKDTIVKNLGPIIGIESHDEEFCKCVNEKIDTSVKNILGTVDIENCKCLLNEHLNNKTDCKCDTCKCEVNSSKTTETGILTDKISTNKLEKEKAIRKKLFEKSDELLKQKNNGKGKNILHEKDNLNFCDCDSSIDTLDSLNEGCVTRTLSFEDIIAENKEKISLSASTDDVQHHKTSKQKNKYEEPPPKVKKNNTQFSNRSSRTKEHKDKTNVKTQQTQLNDNISQNSTQGNKNVTKNIGKQYSNNHGLPPVQSEYIGTINLEKSHDNSKESSYNYYTQPEIIKTKIIGDCSETLCNRKDSTVDLLNRFPLSDKTSGGDRIYINEQEENIKPSDTTVADCCCDYKIKLLGVTLNNGNKQRNTVIKKLQKDKIRADYQIPVKINDIETTLDHKDLDKEDQLDCICCDATNKKRCFTDLEENTFTLLEEYMRKRLEEYRISCKSHCFNPELEERMFNEIFKNVKQTVSENVKEFDCQCTDKESKNRAYDLLQEYLKLKIDRVKCQCDGTKSDKRQGHILSDIYEKICNQIENDFNKIRNLCACDKVNEVNKQATLQTSVDNNNLKMVSAQNSPIKQTENISSQVSHTDTVAKDQGCAYKPYAKELRDFQIGNSITCTCQSFECCDSPVTKSKYIVQQCVPTFNKNEDTFNFKHKSASQLPEVIKITSDGIPNIDSDNMLQRTKEKPSYPYIGYTIGSSNECDNSDICDCLKCMAKRNKNIIQDMWAIYTKPKAPIQKYSYIMSSVPKTEMIYSSFKDSRINIISNTPNNCDEQCCISSHEMLLKVSKDKIRTVTKALDTSNFSDDCSSHTYRKLFDINFNNCVPHRFKNGTINVSSLSHSSCECCKVPVCHVKMLMENIEHKLVECKCTCDALDASVCPVHHNNNQ